MKQFLPQYLTNMSQGQEYAHYMMGLDDALVPPPCLTVCVNREEEHHLPDFIFKADIISALFTIHTEVSTFMVTVINDCECLFEFELDVCVEDVDHG